MPTSDSNLSAVRSIAVRVTRNYGKEAIYPADGTAELFAQLTGTRTLARATIAVIKELGYEVAVQSEVAEL